MGSKTVVWRVVLVTALAVVGGAACSGGDDDGGDEDAAPAFEREETTTTEEEESTTTTDDETTTTTEDDDQDDAGESDDALGEAIAAVEQQAGDVAIFACGAAESNPDVDPAALATALDNTYFVPAAEELVGLDISVEEGGQILVDALTAALVERCPDVADVILSAVST